MRRHCLAAISLIFFLTSAALPAETFITYLEGEVNIERAGAVRPGAIGMELTEGDRISTAVDSLAVLEIEGRGTLKMRGETTMVLDGLEDRTHVTLVAGGLFSRIRRLAGRGYEVRAPNVVAAVRGTEFFVAYGRTVEERPDLWLCVNEGSVEVAVQDSGRSVLVEEGQGVNILASDRITEPRFYPWTNDLNWNTDPDSGSVTDRTDLSGAYADPRDFDYD